MLKLKERMARIVLMCLSAISAMLTPPQVAPQKVAVRRTLRK